MLLSCAAELELVISPVTVATGEVAAATVCAVGTSVLDNRDTEPVALKVLLSRVLELAPTGSARIEVAID